MSGINRKTPIFFGIFLFPLPSNAFGVLMEQDKYHEDYYIILPINL